MPSLDDKAAEIRQAVEGFMIPVFRRQDPHTGRWLNGLSPADFQRATAGYACVDCLAKFKTYMVKCPVCGFTRDLGRDVEAAPDYWVQHIEDRNTGYAPPVRTAMSQIDQILKEISEDPDVEHTTMKKLKPSRWGIGSNK